MNKEKSEYLKSKENGTLEESKFFNKDNKVFIEENGTKVSEVGIYHQGDNVTIYKGSNLDSLKLLEDNSLDSIVTDPPYELGFMGKKWDSTGIAYSVELWELAKQKLKPGGFLLAFSSSRTYHRMAVAIEDAGFLIKDQIMWLYGSGFPKALDIAKSIDKKQVQLDWFADWFKKHLDENNIPISKIQDMFLSKTGGRTGIVSNWLNKINQPTLKQFNKLVKELNLPLKSVEELKREVIGVKERTSGIAIPLQEGGIKIKLDITKSNSDEAKKWDGWKTALKPAHEPIVMAQKPKEKGLTYAQNILKWGVGALNIDESRVKGDKTDEKGRFPANVIHDGSDEVKDAFPNSGSAARFFYEAKAQSKDREQGLECHGTSKRKNIHPTVKPTDLMRYLVRMVTPKGGTIADIFMGSGSTGKGVLVENIINDKNYKFIGMEITEEYLPIARDRIIKGSVEYVNELNKKKPKRKPKKIITNSEQLNKMTAEDMDLFIAREIDITLSEDYELDDLDDLL